MKILREAKISNPLLETLSETIEELGILEDGEDGADTEKALKLIALTFGSYMARISRNMAEVSDLNQNTLIKNSIKDFTDGTKILK